MTSEFLKTIENWRLELAKNIALRNQELNIEELNYVVQSTIDRIIFLRIAEDRGIEKYGQLKELCDLAKNEKTNILFMKDLYNYVKKLMKSIIQDYSISRKKKRSILVLIL